MKKVKVFDCQDMPKNIRQLFFDKNEGVGNDVYVNYYVYSEYKPIAIIDSSLCKYNVDLESYNGSKILFEDVSNGVKYIIEEDDDLISKWLVEKGAKLEEAVLIKHWW